MGQPNLTQNQKNGDSSDLELFTLKAKQNKKNNNLLFQHSTYRNVKTKNWGWVVHTVNNCIILNIINFNMPEIKMKIWLTVTRLEKENYLEHRHERFSHYC